MDFSHLENVKRQFVYVANQQERKGIEKYGKPLNPSDDYDWVDMAIEELVDATKYMLAEKHKRQEKEELHNFIANKVRRLTDDPEIEFWMDKLEGRE